MASRQEEKQRRREERMEVERQAAAARSRTRRLQGGLGALLAVAVVVGVVLAVTGGGGGSSGKGPTAPSAKTGAGAIPAPRERDLAKAVAAAGCTTLDPPIEGHTHTLSKVTYHSNPPSSGSHNPAPALDGIYDPGNTPTPEHFVHALEHGRIEVQYAPGTSRHRVSQLETLVSEPLNGKAGYKTLLFQNNTNMPYKVAATAWGHILGCPRFRPAVFDALRDFRAKWIDKGPEVGIPPTN